MEYKFQEIDCSTDEGACCEDFRILHEECLVSLLNKLYFRLECTLKDIYKRGLFEI